MWLGTLLSCHTCWNSSPTSRQAENQLVCENQIFFTSWRIRSGYVRLIYLERGGHVIYIFARPVGRYQVNVSPFVSAPHSPVTSKAAINFSESEWLSRVMKYIVLKRTKETEPSDKQLAKFPLSLRFFFYYWTEWDTPEHAKTHKKGTATRTSLQNNSSHYLTSKCCFKSFGR